LCPHLATGGRIEKEPDLGLGQSLTVLLARVLAAAVPRMIIAVAHQTLHELTIQAVRCPSTMLTSDVTVIYFLRVLPVVLLTRFQPNPAPSIAFAQEPLQLAHQSRRVTANEEAAEAENSGDEAEVAVDLDSPPSVDAGDEESNSDGR